jgi:hypothetical protein
LNPEQVNHCHSNEISQLTSLYLILNSFLTCRRKLIKE